MTDAKEQAIFGGGYVQTGKVYTNARGNVCIYDKGRVLWKSAKWIRETMVLRPAREARKTIAKSKSAALS